MDNRESLTGMVKRVVEGLCEKSSFYSYPSVWWHCSNVAEVAETLAREVGADPVTAYLGGIFHDVGSISFGREKHHITGFGLTIAILVALDCPKKRINHIARCVFSHRGKPGD